MATERTVLVRLRANADQFSREMVRARAAVKSLREDIDTTNDRTAWMAQGLLALAPAAVTMGATAVPVLAGLATQATVGAGAIGTMVLAFNGVGDALKALNEYQLEPTAKNLAKLDQAMAAIGPDGAEFVRVLDQVGEKLSVLALDARAGMFPGMADGLTSLLERLPQLRVIVTEIAEGIGILSSEAGAGIAGPGFDRFFAFLEDHAQPILLDTGRALGNFIQGFSSLLVDFAPLSKSFTSGLLDMSRGFADWADGLDETAGFQEFVKYIRDNGPDVLQLLGSLANMFVEIAKAAAPVGTIMVPALEALADTIGVLADTPVGSLLILGGALTSLYGRVAALRSISGGPVFGALTKTFRDSTAEAKRAVPTMRQFGLATVYAAHSQKALEIGLNSNSKAAQRSSKAAIEARKNVAAFGKAAVPAAAGIGLLAVSMSPLPEKFGLTRTAMGAMTGMIAGPWGAAAGAAVGLIFDITAGAGEMGAALSAANDALKNMDRAQLESSMSALEDSLDRPINNFEKFFGKSSRRLEKTRFEIGQIEDALRTLDAVGDRSALRDRMEADSKAARDSADAFRDLSKAYEKPKQTLAGLIENMRQWGRAARDMGANIETALSKGVDPAALSDIIDRLGPQAGLAIEQLVKGGKPAIEDFNAAWKRLNNRVTGYETAIDGVKDKLRDFPKPELDLSDKGFRQKMDDALDRMNVLGNTKTNPWVSAYIKPLEHAADEAETRLDKLDKKHPKPKVEPQLTGVPSLITELDRVLHPRTVTVTPNLVGFGGIGRFFAGRSADGSTVPDDGGSYADRFPYLLAPREEVVSNRRGQADNFRPELKDINAGMSRTAVAGRMMARGLADGGTVTRFSTSSSTAPTIEARAARDAAVALKSLAREAKATKEHLSTLRSRRERLRSDRSELMESVSSGLTSDLWSGDEWGGGSDPMSILRGDITKGRAFQAAIRRLRNKGLSGAALAEILRDGDLGRAQQMAAMSRSQLAEYRHLFTERAHVVGTDARAAGNAVYEPALHSIERQIQKLTAEVKRSSRRNSGEHDKDRKSQRAGAQRSGSARNRGVVNR